ncbi:MAG: ABC transporter permease [Bacteroidales bacterium]|nr:ABC transporter permease [Bacteroidales bacterium]
MWIKNLKTFWKHLFHNKLYSLVTILGFAISLTFVLVLSVYIKEQLSVNSQQTNKNRIYRLTNEQSAFFSGPVAPLLQSNFPEIENYTRVYSGEGVVVNPDKLKLKVKYLMVDSSFFQIFSFSLPEGNKETALKTKNSIVLSRIFAHKLFGKGSPVGKQVTIGSAHLIVTGVMGDISKSSNFSTCDALVNIQDFSDISGFPSGLLSVYGFCNFGTYFMARPHTNLSQITPDVLKLLQKDSKLYHNGYFRSVSFEPLLDNYFSSIRGPGIRQNNKTLIQVLFTIVLFILTLSIINYVNLTIAQSGMRAKEIALKKMLGSSRSRLIIQQVIETIVLCFAAFSLAVLFSFLTEPVFDYLLNTKLYLEHQFLGELLPVSIAGVAFTGILSGIVPALFITRLDAVEVLKGNFKRKSRRLYSKLLIGFQYIVVIVLLISSFVISKQTLFMTNRNPGFNAKNILWLENTIKPSQEAGLRSQLLSIPGVNRVSFVKGCPIDGGYNNTFTYHNKLVSFQVFAVDSSFFPMMQMKIKPTGVAYAKNGIWLNETALKSLGMDSLPKSFTDMSKKPKPVLGVVDNFNFYSLRFPIGPLEIVQLESQQYDTPWGILVQLGGNNIVATVDNIRKSYNHFNGNIPFDYRFFDQAIARWYQNEKRTATIISYFTFLSIVISIMGILAMSLYYNRQKTKEIGIRKVNGASVSEIVRMLITEFLTWIAIAFIIAVPIAYYAMHRWLQNFAYKTTLSWWIFALAGIFVLIIAMTAVSWQTFLSARKNPVEALRYE